MLHASARHVIASILGGTGFGERATTLSWAMMLSELSTVPVTTRGLLVRRSAAQAGDPALTYGGPLLPAPLPATQQELCAQLAPVVIAHPAQMGAQLTAFSALCQLWPHIAGDERAPMRARFLAAVVAQNAPAESTVTQVQLRNWQRDLPTAHTDAPPSVATLKALLNETEPHLAYRVLADHLGSNLDLSTLAWVIGSLAAQTLVHLRDPDGGILQVLNGSIALQQLAPFTPPEHLATLASQLAHQLWWCRNRAGLASVRGCLDANVLPLSDAIASGDISCAQRAARTASQQPETFWAAVWGLLDDWSTLHDPAWTKAIALVSAVALRACGKAISTDDAAALGAVFAEMTYRLRTTSAAHAG